MFPSGYQKSHAKAAKDAKDGKGKIFDYFPKLRDARECGFRVNVAAFADLA